MKFEKWWYEIGSGIAPKKDEDREEHVRRVCLEFASVKANPIEPLVMQKIADLKLICKSSKPNAEILMMHHIYTQGWEAAFNKIIRYLDSNFSV